MTAFYYDLISIICLLSVFINLKNKNKEQMKQVWIKGCIPIYISIILSFLYNIVPFPFITDIKLTVLYGLFMWIIIHGLIIISPYLIIRVYKNTNKFNYFPKKINIICLSLFGISIVWKFVTLISFARYFAKCIYMLENNIPIIMQNMMSEFDYFMISSSDFISLLLLIIYFIYRQQMKKILEKGE